MPSNASVEIRKTIVKDALRHDVSLQEERQAWETYALSVPLPEGIDTEQETIGGVPCLWVRAAHSSRQHVIVYVHGGGLIAGSSLTHRAFAARLTEYMRIPVLLADYRLAPEYPYPAGLRDVQSVYQELLQRRFQADQIVFGGDSSGAGLALATLIQLRNDGVCLPAAAFFISGAFDCTLAGESMHTRASIDPFTSQEVLAHCCQLYAQDIDLRSPLISTVYDDLTRLPPLLLQVGDHEILLSDSVRVAEKVQHGGGEVWLRVWDSMWHTWPLYQGLPEAQDALAEIRDFLKTYCHEITTKE